MTARFRTAALPQEFLANPPQISPDKAKAVALGFLNPEEQFGSIRVENVDGGIPACLVTGKRADGSEVSISVAKAGGAVLWAMDQRSRVTATVDIETARRAAREFLASKGMESLVETGWRKSGNPPNRAVFVFAATSNLTANARPPL